MTRRPRGTMPFPPAPTPGVPAARAPPRRPGAPRRPAAPACAPPAPSPPAAAAEKRRPPELPGGLLSGSWPSTTLKRPPARAARSGPSPPGASGRFSLSLTPEAALRLQRRPPEKLLPARSCRPLPSPAAARRPPPPGSPQARAPRPALRVSLLSERLQDDDVEDEEAAPVPDEGLIRKCTEWLRGVEQATAARDLSGSLDTLPHLSTL